MRAKDALGRYGEELAVRHLERLGLVVLDRNWRCKHGEIDIVARDGSTLVIGRSGASGGGYACTATMLSADGNLRWRQLLGDVYCTGAAVELMKRHELAVLGIAVAGLVGCGGDEIDVPDGVSCDATLSAGSDGAYGENDVTLKPPTGIVMRASDV